MLGMILVSVIGLYILICSVIAISLLLVERLDRSNDALPTDDECIKQAIVMEDREQGYID